MRKILDTSLLLALQHSWHYLYLRPKPQVMSPTWRWRWPEVSAGWLAVSSWGWRGWPQAGEPVASGSPLDWPPPSCCLRPLETPTRSLSHPRRPSAPLGNREWHTVDDCSLRSSYQLNEVPAQLGCIWRRLCRVTGTLPPEKKKRLHLMSRMLEPKSAWKLARAWTPIHYYFIKLHIFK